MWCCCAILFIIIARLSIIIYRCMKGVWVFTCSSRRCLLLLFVCCCFFVLLLVCSVIMMDGVVVWIGEMGDIIYKNLYIFYLHNNNIIVYIV